MLPAEKGERELFSLLTQSPVTVQRAASAHCLVSGGGRAGPWQAELEPDMMSVHSGC